MSSNVAAIDGVTGPGRRTILLASDVQELNFKLKKKIIEVTNWDGSIGQYDLAEVNNIQVSSDGDNFTVAMTSKMENEDARKREESRTSDPERADSTGGSLGRLSYATPRDTASGRTSETEPAKPGPGSEAENRDRERRKREEEQGRVPESIEEKFRRLKQGEPAEEARREGSGTGGTIKGS